MFASCNGDGAKYNVQFFKLDSYFCPGHLKKKTWQFCIPYLLVMKPREPSAVGILGKIP